MFVLVPHFVHAADKTKMCSLFQVLAQVAEGGKTVIINPNARSATRVKLQKGEFRKEQSGFVYSMDLLMRPDCVLNCEAELIKKNELIPPFELPEAFSIRKPKYLSERSCPEGF